MIGKRSDHELADSEPRHAGGEAKLHKGGRRAEVFDLFRKGREVEVSNVGAEGCQKAKGPEQVGS